jgi:hypothetical protein
MYRSVLTCPAHSEEGYGNEKCAESCWIEPDLRRREFAIVCFHDWEELDLGEDTAVSTDDKKCVDAYRRVTTARKAPMRTPIKERPS